MNDLDQKINKFFPGLVVRKDLVKTVKGNAIVPSYVLEYLLGQYCATSDEPTIQTGIETVKEILAKHYVHRNEAGLVRSNIKEKGRYKVIDKISVDLNDKKDIYQAQFSNLGLKEVLVDSGTVKKHPKLLVGGVWCIADLEYEFTEDNGTSPWILSTLKPIQLSHFDFDSYVETRKQFTTDEWIDLLLQSVGFNPELLGKRSKLTQLVRLIPFCERNYNLIELGPKGTGKSHIYSEFSPHGILISGGEVTVPKLFVNNSSGKIGLVGYWDCVAFDEFAGKQKRVDKALVDIMKNYMANKSFSRGVETLGAEASMVFVGNTDHTVPYMLKHTDLFDPLPEKFHGLTDQEQKYRLRHLDLIMNEQSRFTFMARSRIVQSIRNYMSNHGFLEVETPMMHPIPGGASARPFVTHHNTLDMDLYLRIAPELYLKKLVVGGFEKVFELNRNFRNEGMSPRHNPEFTMMEFYEAYSEYNKLMDFTEGLLRHSAREALGAEFFEYQGRTLDLSKPFARLTMVEAVMKYKPQYTLEQLTDADWLRQKLTAMKVEVKPGTGLGTLQLLMFEETAEADLWDPTFIVDYPAEISPLARASDSNRDITERFELFIVGREIANGFSELNDPEDQAERFLSQAKAKEAGDEEAMYYDADFIRALEYGMPPAGGCGIGIDRLMMLLTDSANIRDVILFPQMRPE
jgi:lysyl-tRNA synthetase